MRLIITVLICMWLLNCTRQNCGGLDIIYSIASIHSKLLNDTIDTKFIQQGYTDLWQIIQFRDSIRKRPGNRKCRQKDLAAVAENNIICSAIEVSCNSAMVCDEDTVPAFTNIRPFIKIENALENNLGIGFSEKNYLRFGCTPLQLNKTIKFFTRIPLTDGKVLLDTLNCWAK